MKTPNGILLAIATTILVFASCKKEELPKDLTTNTTCQDSIPLPIKTDTNETDILVLDTTIIYAPYNTDHYVKTYLIEESEIYQYGSSSGSSNSRSSRNSIIQFEVVGNDLIIRKNFDLGRYQDIVFEIVTDSQRVFEKEVGYDLHQLTFSQDYSTFTYQRSASYPTNVHDITGTEWGGSPAPPSISGTFRLQVEKWVSGSLDTSYMQDIYVSRAGKDLMIGNEIYNISPAYSYKNYYSYSTFGGPNVRFSDFYLTEDSLDYREILSFNQVNYSSTPDSIIRYQGRRL
jgi:hypothetical protein